MLEYRFPLAEQVSLRRTLGAVVQGRRDPCAVWRGEQFWAARDTPEGSVAFGLEVVDGSLRYLGVGDGAEWAASIALDLAGQHYSQKPFEDPFVEELRLRSRDRRIPRTHAVFETLVWTILAQRVTGMEAKHSWLRLARIAARLAPHMPGIPSMLLPPTPSMLAELPHFTFHQCGVDRGRSQTIRIAARCERRIRELTAMLPEAGKQRLTSLRGVGEWSANEVAMFALGDIDAVSVGDFHLSNQVGWTLAKRVRSSDEEMLTLLEPFRGRRGEVTRFIAGGHSRPPAFGPRYDPLPIANM